MTERSPCDKIGRQETGRTYHDALAWWTDITMGRKGGRHRSTSRKRPLRPEGQGNRRRKEAHKILETRGSTTIRLRTFCLRHFVYRHFVYRHFVYNCIPACRTVRLYIQLLFQKIIIFINSNFYLHYDSVLSIQLPLTM